MKRSLLALVILVAGSGLLFAEIDWNMDYDSAMRKAGNTGSDLFVLITAPDWCGPCQYMEAATFTDSDVIDTINSNFIPLKVLDRVDGSWNQDQNYFDFDGYPTYLIMTADERVVFQDSGAVDSYDFLDAITPYLPAEGVDSPYTPSQYDEPVLQDEPNLNFDATETYPGEALASVSRGLVAYFPFSGDMEDAVGLGSRILPYSFEPESGRLYSDGEYATDYGEYFMMYPEDFSIESFTLGMSFFIEDSDPRMNFITVGEYSRWFSIRIRDGEIQITFNNQDDVYPTGIREIEPGTRHSLLCAVDIPGGEVSFIFDGRDYSFSLPSYFSLNLDPGDYVDDDFSLTNFSNGDVFKGYIDDLFVYNRVLTASELETFRDNMSGVSVEVQEEAGEISVSGELEPEMLKGMPDGSEVFSPLDSELERTILERVNRDRRKYGLDELIWSDELANAARYHAADMAEDDYFHHDTYDRNSSGGLSILCDFTERIEIFAPHVCVGTSCIQIRGVLENIGAGGGDAQGFMETWMGSPDHRDRILSEEALFLGVGYWESPDSNFDGYCVQVFGY